MPRPGPPDGATLELRVGLLLAYAERAPRQCCREPSLRLSLLPLVAAFVLAHAGSTAALDAVHVASEAAVLFALDPR